MTGARGRARRLVAVLFGLSLLLTACDADDVMLLLRGPDADAAAPAAPADAASDETAQGRNGSSGSDEAAASDGDDAPTSHEPSGDATASAPQRAAQDKADAPAPKAQKKPKPSGSGSGSATSISATEREIFDLLSAVRANNGRTTLTLSAEISRGARAWSCEMARSGNFRHADLRSAGVNGENIAWGQRSADEVHQGWMDSPGHRDNRMSDRWTEYGVGVCRNDDGRLYFTERFR
jgi:uncharacterized protein YkwD